MSCRGVAVNDGIVVILNFKAAHRITRNIVMRRAPKCRRSTRGLAMRSSMAAYSRRSTLANIGGGKEA